MNYRTDRYGNQLSILGFGCMRFPQTLGKIDMKETEAEIRTAYEAGVNYYDTAYIYPGSEATLGEILEKNQIREKVYIATKLPHYLIKSIADMDKIFAEELRRLRTDYIDYYLMHMLTDTETWERLKSLGIEEWIERKKAGGAIRQIGFSYHGNSEMFCKLVDYVICTTLRKNSTAASNCIQCGKCEKHCPQHIEIRKHLKDAKKELETPVYKVVRNIVKRFVKF